MRSFDKNDKYDCEELSRINPPDWMVGLLNFNPPYVHWGPCEDYMAKQGNGWESPILFAFWKEHNIVLDELNEVVNFYFSVETDYKKCDCDSGYSSEAARIKKSLPFNRDDLTPEHRKVLIAEGRGNSRGRFNFCDAIDEHVLINYECQKQGFSRTCPKCSGHARISTSLPYAVLTYWLLHPRKGASRGVEVKHIAKEDLPEVIAFLKEAARRNAGRFQKILDL